MTQFYSLMCLSDYFCGLSSAGMEFGVIWDGVAGAWSVHCTAILRCWLFGLRTLSGRSVRLEQASREEKRNGTRWEVATAIFFG